MNITPGVYQNKQGKKYMVLGVADHTRDGEQLVIYGSVVNSKYYAQPLRDFLESDLKLFQEFQKIS